MQELVLGIDVCDDYSQISYYNPQVYDVENIGLTDEEGSCMIPTVICKEKGTDSWYIGEEAPDLYPADPGDPDGPAGGFGVRRCGLFVPG